MATTPLTGHALLDATGSNLREVLTRLFHYKQTRAKHLDPKAPFFEATQKHLNDIGHLLLAAQAYSGAVDECLAQAGPPLALLTPAELLAHREADPVYRLGFVRGHRRGTAQTEARYEHLVSLYAQYAVLVPPPGYTPSPLVARVNSFLEAPDLQARAALPLAQRQALAAVTSHHLPPIQP